jgi:OmcA/MtrC family decaheme c-type cytochrome
VVPANTPATDYLGTLSSVTISPAGAVTVTFSLTDTAGTPVTGAEVKPFEFQIAKLVPATATKPAYWQSYINRSAQEGTVKVFEGGNERGNPVAVAGTPGAYTYTFCTPLAAVATFQYYGSGTEPAGSCATAAVGRAGVIASPAWDAVRPTLNLAYDPAATTRIAILGRNGVVVNIVKDFVPASLPTMLATTAHEMVTEESCGACHAESSANRAKLLFGNKGSGHLGRRYDLGTCTSCHNAGSFNPELSTDAAWVSLDLKNIVHEVHSGHYPQNAPFGGVGGIGTGFDGGLGVQNCRTCHDNQNPKILPLQPAARTTADKMAWQENISQQACNSCHAVDFAAHFGNQPDNASCTLCHGPGRALPVTVAHATPYSTPNNPELVAGAKKVEYQIASMTVDATTRQPTVRFRVLVDGTPLDLKTLPTAEIAIGALNMKLAWSSPITQTTGTSNTPSIASPVDWNNFGGGGRTFWNNTVTTGLLAYDQPTSVNLSTAGLIASLTGPDADGYFTTAPGINPAAPLAFPAGDLTLRAVAMESYLTINAMNISGDAAMKGVDGANTLRRAVVDINSCNTCHERIGFHSNAGRMNSPEYCATCHNPEVSNSNLYEGPGQYGTMTEVKQFAQHSNNFKEMIHSIHAAPFRNGPTQSGSVPFNFIRGNPNATGGNGPMVLGEFEEYPAQVSDCQACHLPNTYALPSNANYAWTVTRRDMTGADLVTAANKALYDPSLAPRQGPSAGACGSCHAGTSAKVHFQINTIAGIGESCNVCHGPGKPNEAHR